MFERITDDLDAMLESLPPHIAQPLRELCLPISHNRSENVRIVASF
jgi:hypothetical protein